jgi:hypothetical protein
VRNLGDRSVGPYLQDFSFGWALAGIAFFLPIGILLLFMPYAVQRYALHLYQYPGDEQRARFLRRPSYIWSLRVVGLASFAVGLFLAAITIMALLMS